MGVAVAAIGDQEAERQKYQRLVPAFAARGVAVDRLMLQRGMEHDR